MHYCCTPVRHRLISQCLSPILLLHHIGKHQLISISSDDDFIASEDDCSNDSNSPSSNDNNSDSDSNSDSCAYDSDLENALARTPTSNPTTTTIKKLSTKAPLTSSATTTPKTGSKAVLKASASSSTGSSGAAFAKQRAALTTQYFTEFNKRVFSGALTDVAVTWNKRLNSTAGITKLSK
jgi:hypothetical protein